jgi:hypothetical protein
MKGILGSGGGGGGGEGLASNKISTIFNKNTIHISGFLKFDFYLLNFKSIFSFLRCFVWHVLLLPRKNEKSNLRGYGKIQLPGAAPRC